jgi:hypothetical protein
MQRRLVALFFFLGLLCTSCASILPRDATHITVEELPFRHWRATYILPAPQKALVFERARGAFRAGSWRIVAPAGARWTMARGHETIVSPQAASRFVVEFFTDTKDREKDYKLHVAFSDGSRLLYTGHLMVQGALNAFTFHSPSREEIIVPTTEKDTYVYFGTKIPVQAPRMRMVVDPGLPRWMAAQLAEHIPATFDYFAEVMGTPLDFDPITYASYGGPGRGYVFVGGTLDRVVQMEIRGHDWFVQSDVAAQNWFGRAAHEIFHLWESQRFHKREDGEWLGEASAEYARIKAMQHFGIINERGAEEAVVQAANECINTIGDTNLSNAIAAGHFRTVYTCGLVAQWLSGDAFAIDRRTFSRNASWGTAEYLASLHELSANPAPVERLVTGHIADPEVFLETELSKAGLRVKREGKVLRLE